MKNFFIDDYLKNGNLSNVDLIAKKLAFYLEDYLNEEKARGNDPIDNQTIYNGIDAFLGGAGDE